VVRKEKDYEKMKNNPKNVSKEHLIKVLKYFGFIVDTGRGKGGHFMVTHETISESLTIPSNKPIKTQYIRDCIRLIEEVNDNGKK